MDKPPLPHAYVGRTSRVSFFVKLLVLSSLASLSFFGYALSYFPGRNRGLRIPLHAVEVQARCRSLDTKPSPPPGFHDRAVSDRFVEGTKHIWIRNATIWTGRVQGLEVIQGDVLLMNGIIKAVGHVDLQSLGLSDHGRVEVLDAHDTYITPGYVHRCRVPLSHKLKLFVCVESSTSIRIWVLSRPLRSKALGT